MKCYVFLCFVVFFGSFGIKCDKNNKHSIAKKPHQNTIKYNIKHTEIRIPVMIHIDKILAKTLSNNRKRKIKANFRLLAKDILKDVEFLFSKMKLAQKIKFDLKGLEILRNNSRMVVLDENVSKYLENYCVWQGEKKKSKHKWFLSVLFTGLDLYYLDAQGSKVKRSASRGYMRGICHYMKSCTVLEWKPRNMAFKLAHEIAHSFGVEHDGPPRNECKGTRHVMDASHNPENPAKTWSRCSRRAFIEFLKTDRAWCLREPWILRYRN